MYGSPDQSRRPKNAIPIPTRPRQSPPPVMSSVRSMDSEHFYSFGNTGSQQAHAPTMRPLSPSSEIEVVMDDGTLQRRTVSLSTTVETRYHDTLDHILGGGGANAPSFTRPASIMTSHDTIDTDNEDPQQQQQPLLSGWNRKAYQSTTIREEEEEDETMTSNSSSDDAEDQTAFFLEGGSTEPWPKDETPSLLKRLGALELTAAQKAVLKCSFAYLLGSLFTFIPSWNAWIGNNRSSSHLVATATVFFNPAKSLGGMVEAAAYGWGYTFFALLVCLGSMATTDFFIDHQMTLVAHIVSLFFWLAGAAFIVAFLKAHWNKPPVASASSLCFIIIFIIVVKEGSVNQGAFDTTRIEQITSVVAIGTLVTVTCCIVFWPTSATTKLQQDLDKTLQSYQVLLKLLTKTFLLDDDLPEFTANQSLQSAIESHRGSFTSLQKSLQEAKLESLWNAQIRGCADEYDTIVKSMQRLSQHVGGLRSSCGVQFFHHQRSQQEQDQNHANEPIPYAESAHDDTHLAPSPSYAQDASLFVVGTPGTTASMAVSSRSMLLSPRPPSDTWSVYAGHRRRQLESEMKRQRAKKMDVQQQQEHQPMENEKEGVHIENDDDDQLSLNEPYTTTLIDYVHTIRHPLKSLAYTCKRTLYHLQQGIKPFTSRHRFLLFSSHALPPDCLRLKQNLIKALEVFDRAQHRAMRDPINKVTDDLCLVYFFVFNLKEFTNELISLVDAVHVLTVKQQRIPLWRYLWHNLAKLLSRHRPNAANFSSIKPFVPNERHRLDTLHTPSPTTKWRKFFLQAWRTMSLFKLQKMRYAVKSMLAAVLLASPCFIAATGPLFRAWRMEWALITLMVVMTPTVGGTNIVAVYRIFSTMLGCFSAMVFYMLFPGNMVVLAVLTWLFSLPNFWLILHHKHGKFGQFTLLAYNLVMLNKYNDRDTNSIEVWRLAFQRCVAILVGVLAGLVATNYWWPYEARVELRKGLSDFLLRLAWLYERLVATRPPSHSKKLYDDEDDNPVPVGNPLVPHSPAWVEQELALQRDLIELYGLLAQTPNEPRLKGAFPVETYRQMLAAGQNLVDKMIAIRTVVTKEVWTKEVYPSMVVPTGRQGRDMVGNVLLYLYLLASALHLKTPLPPYLPPVRAAWANLIHELRRDKLRNNHAYMIYFAYVVMMEDIIYDLDKLGEHMTLLFGALVPQDEWQKLFEPSEMEQGHGLSIVPASHRLTQAHTQ
ncbi:Fusaric acid resistance protein-like-domain-containing protein [Gongronella butleri]|nr:Fusaric acid resistance protein-like-domain-containing protein [Gongronella butleri]